MLALVVVIVFGILFALFATQNTETTSITMANYQISGIPLYIVVLGSFLIGVLVSLVFSFFDSISHFFTLSGKDSTISGQNRTINDLKLKIRDLEKENAKLKGERDATTPKFGVFRKPTIAS